MSVTDFDEIHVGRSVSSSIQGNRTVQVYHHVYRAITDDAHDNGEVVRAYASCPKEGWEHPTNQYAYCRSVEARNEGFSKLVWIVTAVYSTERELSDNPLNDPADIKWRSEQYQRWALLDKDGNAIVNTAGEWFDPSPMRDDSRWIATVQKNLAAIPAWIVNYQDAINSSTFTLDALDVTARQAQMQAIEISSWQYRDGTPFRTLTMIIALAKDGFKLQIPNVGFNQKDPDDEEGPRIPCVDKHLRELAAPALLDADGFQVENPTPAAAAANRIQAQVYEERDFNVLPLV